MRVVISKCLLGCPCRYDGQSKPSPAVQHLAEKVDVVGVCPEVEGGLSCPRTAAEQVGALVLTKDGRDVTKQYWRGARLCLEKTLAAKPPFAVLKAKSPSCGHGMVYDGTYTSTLVPGDGIFTRLLNKEEISVVTENVVEACKPSVEHPVAIILGTGLGHLAGLVKPVRHIDYHDIDGFPLSAQPVKGHLFEATIGTIDEVPVVVYPGRIHLYQGYSAAEVTSLVRHAYSLGCRDIIFACATGAVPGQAELGLGLVEDQINLTGHDPLSERDNICAVNTRFLGMTDAYSPYMLGLAKGVAEDEGIEVGQGVLAGTVGPSFETPAEVRALSTLGVSYVGMSTVCEVIMAHALDMNVLAITQAGNRAGDPSVSHKSVLDASKKYEQDFEKLVRGVLHLL